MSVRWAFNYGLWKPSREEWMLASRCIQKEERQRIGRFCFARDAKASMAGRLLMRKYLSDKLGYPYNEIKLERTDKGKPFVSISDGCARVYDFNVSHQGSFSVLAADASPKVGVDVMKIEYTGGKPLPDFFNLMSRQFSPSEWNFICMPGLEKEQLARFIRLWCLKESFVKAEGIGIGFDLQRLSFWCHTPVLLKDGVVTDTQLLVDGTLCDGWVFEESLIDEEHCVSVAFEVDKLAHPDVARNTTFVHLTFQDVIQGAVPLYDDEDSDDAYWEDFVRKPEKPG